jgi:hypothetical protein
MMMESSISKEAYLRVAFKGWQAARNAARAAAAKAGKSPGAHMDEAVQSILAKSPMPEGYAKGIHGADPHKAYEGHLRQVLHGGDGSILLWPIKALAEKAIGGSKGIEKVRGAAWKYIHRPALRADIAAGRVAEKVPLVGKSLFRMKESVPWGPPGEGLHKEILRSSALAPLAKARDIAEPILVGVGLEKGLKKLRDWKTQSPNMDDQNLREKAASVMLHLHEKNEEHEKRGHALRVLFKKAELGYETLPKTFSELDTKLAALVTEDLVVLEKALELAGGNLKLGELDRRDPEAAANSAEKFQAAILGDEL